jgi:hypothetical protein
MKAKIIFYLWFPIKTCLKLVFAFALLFILFSTSNASVFVAAATIGDELEKNTVKSALSGICSGLAIFLFVLGLANALWYLSRMIWKTCCNHCLPKNPFIRAAEAPNDSRFLRRWKD